MTIPRTCLTLALVLAGCRGEPPGSGAFQRTVDSLVPQVEAATGIRFSKPPRFAVRTKAEVKRYLDAKIRQQFPAAKVEGLQAMYRLLELVPDSVDLRALLLGLYAEQVAGFYDPDSTTLFAVEGADRGQLRLVLAHELVHALQHERLPLGDLLKDAGNADRAGAAQAVLEGHATLATMRMIRNLVPSLDGQQLLDLDSPEVWRQFRESVKEQQTTMPVFRSAPLVLREELIFPYLSGAEFLRWWQSRYPGEGPIPSVRRLPRSTEQILHPERYASGDGPVTLEFTEPAPDLLHEDTMGELELQVWTTELRGGGEVLTSVALGWGGDRFRVYRTPAGPALVLATVWDDSISARRFATLTGSRFVDRPRPGYRTTVNLAPVDGRPGVRIVRAPAGWAQWPALPAVRVRIPAPGAPIKP